MPDFWLNCRFIASGKLITFTALKSCIVINYTKYYRYWSSDHPFSYPDTYFLHVCPGFKHLLGFFFPTLLSPCLLCFLITALGEMWKFSPSLVFLEGLWFWADEVSLFSFTWADSSFSSTEIISSSSSVNDKRSTKISHNKQINGII